MEVNSKARTALKTFVALIAAAAVPALIVAGLYGITSGVLRDPPASAMSAMGTALLVSLAFTMSHAFILGLPLLLLGIKLRTIRWWSCVVVGLLIGFIPSAWVSAPDILSAWPIAVLGAIAGLIVWLLWHFWVQRPTLIQRVPTATG